MARSHICPRCGTELAGTPARLGTVVAQPVVVCPRCGSGWARSPRRDRRAALELRRTAKAAAGLALNAAVAFFAMMFVVGSSFSLALVATSLDLADTPFGFEHDTLWQTDETLFEELVFIVLWHRFPLGGVIVFLLASVAAGAWSACLCTHRTTFRAWTDWLVICLLGLLTVAAIDLLIRNDLYSRPQPGAIREAASIMLLAMTLVCLSTGSVVAVFPVRSFLRRTRARSARRRWVFALRRARAVRRGYA